MTTRNKYVKTHSGSALRDFLSHANAEFDVAKGFLGVSGLAQWVENNINEPYVKVTENGKLRSCKNIENLTQWQ